VKCELGGLRRLDQKKLGIDQTAADRVDGETQGLKCDDADQDAGVCAAHPDVAEGLPAIVSQESE
jgi:hypothetical protein